MAVDCNIYSCVRFPIMFFLFLHDRSFGKPSISKFHLLTQAEAEINFVSIVQPTQNKLNEKKSNNWYALSSSVLGI